MLPEFRQIAAELVEAGCLLYSLGMVSATSGNFSARLPDNNRLITVSGRNKGRLMLADATGKNLDGKQPSAETQLHVQIYKRFPEVCCVLHPHSVNATVLSLLTAADVELPSGPG